MSGTEAIRLLTGVVRPSGLRSHGCPSWLARHHTWIVLLALGLGAIGGYYLVPEAGVAQAVILCVVNLTAAVFAFRVASRARGLDRTVWLGLAVGQTLCSLANVPYYAYPLITGSRLPFPTVVDALFLAMYPAYGVALWALAKQRREVKVEGGLVDALIVLVGGGSVMWAFALAPAIQTEGLSLLARVVATLYPVMDLAVFAVLARLLVGSWENGAFRLVVASFTALLLSDLVYQKMLADGTYHFGGPTDGLWMLSYLLIAVAAVHPSARSFAPGTESAPEPMTGGRLAFLAASALVGPILLATGQDTPVVAFTSVATVLLVVTRMATLNRRLGAARLVVEHKTEELRHRALHDSLTGLPNRTLVIDRADQLLARARRTGAATAALYLDIDGFKAVNDSFGHGAGDELLRIVAARLSEAVRESDTVGRLGGDEFVVLADDFKLDAGPELLAERLCQVLAQPVSLSEAAGHTVTVTASIGIALGQHNTPDDLFRDADYALYEAKRGGGNRAAVFESRLQTVVQERLTLQMDLSEALDGGQLFLVYQPTFDLQTLRVTGVEALIRWLHPTRGVISPGEFIPIAEESGLIAGIGHWVLDEACRQAVKWHRSGHRIGVSVNVSACQLEDPGLALAVEAAIRRSEIDPALLTLEITETALMRDVQAAIERLRELKALGVRLAIDDFGTGYSSLAYVHAFPVDILKIDRSFISSMTESDTSRAIVHTLMQLGEALKVVTLAEGIETPDQLRRLQREGCEHGQGFLLAKPMAAEATEGFLAEWEQNRTPAFRSAPMAQLALEAGAAA
jgi:diguanylate cyclase